MENFNKHLNTDGETAEVFNRYDGTTVYNLPEYGIRRSFTVFETKTISLTELNALWQTEGGRIMLKDFLVVNDEKWIKTHWSDVPEEYFWKYEDVEKCLRDDPADWFEETLHYAPESVIALIKTASWKMPLNDLNKANIIKRLLGFDCIAAAKIMSVNSEKTDVTTIKKERLRQRKEG